MKKRHLANWLEFILTYYTLAQILLFVTFVPTPNLIGFTFEVSLIVGILINLKILFKWGRGTYICEK